MEDSEIAAIIWELVLSDRSEVSDASYEKDYLQALNDLLEVFAPNMTLNINSSDGLALSGV